MIGHIELSHGKIIVHLAETGLRATKSFTHGGITFDKAAGTVTFGSLPPVPLPPGLELADKRMLEFQLAGPDGELKKQTRTGVLNKVEGTEVFRIAGQSKTTAQFTADDGWCIEVFKYRAYFTHPGLNTNGEIPQWLRESIKRQRAFWNRLAWLCRDARRKCSPEATDEVKKFVQQTLLPGIDALNNSLGRSNQKLKHPGKLKVDEPNVDGLYSFIGVLRARIEKGKPIPDGLLDRIVEFVDRFKPDYKPINDFQNNILKIGKKEADGLGLTWYEAGPTLKRFMAVLRARKTLKRGWSEGWPFIKYPDSPGADDWSLTYYLNKAGLMASNLEAERGVPGLRFGKPKVANETGHPEMKGVAAERRLREATITLKDDNRQPMEFRFGVLQHRPIPDGSHIKQWQLAEVDGKLWLNLTLEIKRDVPASPTQGAAGLDVGWRRTEEGIRIGVLHEPTSGIFKEILLDFQRSPKDHRERVPFHLNLGPTRWEKRNITSFFPDWKPGDTMPGTVVLRDVLATRRSYFKDTAKALLRKHLGDAVPAWFDRAGKRGLLKLAEDLKDDSTVQKIVSEFRTNSDALNKLASEYFEMSTRRIEYGYQQIAHDILKFVQGKGLNRIMIEENFLAKISKQEPDRDGEGYYALANSQKYRQFAAVGKFVGILQMIARKYGISIEEAPAINTTRVCHECGYLNSATFKRRYQCEGCHRVIDQDYNAAANLSQFEAVESAA